MKFLELKKQLRFSLKKGYKQPREFVEPAREWLIGLSLSGIVFLGGVVYAGHIFLDALHDAELERIESEETGRNFSPERLRRVLETYEDRGERFETLKREHVKSSNVEGLRAVAEAPAAQ